MASFLRIVLRGIHMSLPIHKPADGVLHDPVQLIRYPVPPPVDFQAFMDIAAGPLRRCDPVAHHLDDLAPDDGRWT